jgi:hypothetical protein
MEPTKFRKLHVDLPLEPVTNDRPWLIVGWVVACVFFIFVVCAYLKYKGFF